MIIVLHITYHYFRRKFNTKVGHFLMISDEDDRFVFLHEDYIRATPAYMVPR